MEGEFLDELEFHYLKSNSFRVIHCDGVWGGVTPRSYIAMSFFSERYPIPQKIVHELESDGALGEQTGRDSKKGIIREVEVEVTVDLETAKSLRTWLKAHIDFIEAQQAQEKQKE